MLRPQRFKFKFVKRAPVAGEEDNPPAGLPPELVGKTPAEIAAFYADRETTIMENARRMVNEARQNTPPNTPPPNTPPPNTPPTDPKYVTQEQLRNLTESARAGLVNMAIMTAKVGKEHWDRLFPDVKKIVDALSPESAVNADIWTEAYYNVQGRMTDTLITEARNRALGLEPPSPPVPPAPKARTFTSDELSVIEGCGITKEMYAQAETRLAENYQPFTTDNRRGRVG